MEKGVETPSGGESFADFGDDGHSRWQNIVQRYTPPLRGYFATRVSCQEDIDDLVQIVFVRLLQRVSDDPIEHVGRYIFQAAANVLQDQRRRHKVRQHGFHDSYDDALHGRDAGISVERAVLADCELDHVETLVKELPLPSRQIFFMRFKQQCTHEEVAATMRMSVRNVHKHIARIYQHIGRLPEGDD